MESITYYLLQKGIITVEDVQRCTVLELLTLIIERLNITIEDVVKIETEIETLFNDRLQQDIINKLNGWIADGTMDNLINQTVFAGLNDKIDKASDIIPDLLRTSDSQTDADLLQLAINQAINQPLSTKAIRLNRVYEITKPITLSKSASWTDNSVHLVIKDGQLKHNNDGFMFTGVKNSGGLNFENVTFLGVSGKNHPMIDARNLIQIDFNHCQFKDTYCVIASELTTEDNQTDYIQSLHIHSCNFKGMKDYQIKCLRAYDVTINQSYFEWGAGGVMRTYQKTTNNSSALNIIITNNVIEGITEQIPLYFNHPFALIIEGNYFEGNTKTDIYLDSSVNTTTGFSINRNFFGSKASYQSDGVEGVFIGTCVGTQEILGNKCIQPTFKVQVPCYAWLDVQGTRCISNKDAIINRNDVYNCILDLGTMGEHKVSTENNNAWIPLEGYLKDLANQSLHIELTYDMVGSPLYRAKLVGDLYFVVGYENNGTVLKAKFVPTLIIDNNSMVNQTELGNFTITIMSTNSDTIPYNTVDDYISSSIRISRLGSSKCLGGICYDNSKVITYF